MLAKIREKTQGIIATFILALVGIPFVLWGINSYFDGGGSLAVAKVNGAEISQQAYRRALDELRGVDPKRAENRAFRELVLESLISQTLLTEDAADRGYRVSDGRLAQLIRDIPYFQRDGRFDGALYESLLRREGMTPADFEARVRRDSVTGQVQRGLSETAFVTEADVNAVVGMLLQQRRLSYAIIRPDLFADVKVSPDEVTAYYESNQDRFRTPEEVRVEYLLLSAAEIAKQYSPSEQELREAYEAEKARYVTPERRRASHILVNLPADADAEAVKAATARMENIAKEARKGADFAKLAQKHSEDRSTAAKGGDLGELSRGLLPAELETAVYALKAGEVTQPVRTSYGLHVVKLTALTPETRRPLESVRQELAAQVRARKGEERFLDLAEQFRNLVYEHPDSLEPAAKALKLDVRTSNWFNREHAAPPLANPRAIEATFDPEVVSGARNSDAVEIAPDQLIAIHVIDHRPSSVRPLAEVRAGIERALKEQKARDQASATAEQWLVKLREGAALEALARSVKAAVQTGKLVTREQPGGVDRRMVDAVFAAARPDGRPVYVTADLGNQGQAVIAIEEVRDGEPAKADAALKEKVRRQLLARRGAEYYSDYRAGLRRQADVKIYGEQL